MQNIWTNTRHKIDIKLQRSARALCWQSWRRVFCLWKLKLINLCSHEDRTKTKKKCVCLFVSLCMRRILWSSNDSFAITQPVIYTTYIKHIRPIVGTTDEINSHQQMSDNNNLCVRLRQRYNHFFFSSRIVKGMWFLSNWNIDSVCVCEWVSERKFLGIFYIHTTDNRQ